MTRRVRVFTSLVVMTAVATMLMLWQLTMREAKTNGFTMNQSNVSRSEFFKLIHLDLKGAPPKISYLISLLPMIKAAGGNALLIEYEDAFPFSGSLTNISSRSSYKLDEIRKLVTTAEAAHFEVIPLVQTFGHMEYVLKLEEFRHLREEVSSPMEICPSRNDAVLLVKEMIRQIMAVHSNARYIHIGCDEVRYLGKCPVCSRRKAKNIFANHVYRMGSYVRATYPGVVPLIWDDMMRTWSIYDVQSSGLASVVEPVVWAYNEDIPRLVPHYLWYIYFKNFPRIWAASAFKGATGETEVIPNLARVFENNLSWIKFIKNRKDRVDAAPNIFRGIVLTGWSRYDHFALLCELLPAGIPSLVLNLVLAERNLLDKPGIYIDRKVFRKWLEILRCPRGVPDADQAVIGNRHYQLLLGNCDFPGSSVYRLAFEYLILKDKVNSVERMVEDSAWVSRYNLKKNFTSPWRVAKTLTADIEEVIFKTIGLLKSSITDAMAEFYDDFVISEWLEQKIEPLEERIGGIYKNLKSLMRRSVWPRRPLP